MIGPGPRAADRPRRRRAAMSAAPIKSGNADSQSSGVGSSRWCAPAARGGAVLARSAGSTGVLRRSAATDGGRARAGAGRAPRSTRTGPGISAPAPTTCFLTPRWKRAVPRPPTRAASPARALVAATGLAGPVPAALERTATVRSGSWAAAVAGCIAGGDFSAPTVGGDEAAGAGAGGGAGAGAGGGCAAGGGASACAGRKSSGSTYPFGSSDRRIPR
jgi:hypothetical protein